MLPDWRSSGPTELGDLVELAALIDSVGLLQAGLVSDHPGWPVLCALWHSRQDGHVDPEGSIRLLPAILWELPSLPAAACRDHWPDFDDRLPGETPQRRAQRLEAVEGYGLLRRRQWGEYLTVVSTALLFVPEVHELLTRPTGLKIGGFILNVVIVVYLVIRIIRR